MPLHQTPAVELKNWLYINELLPFLEDDISGVVLLYDGWPHISEEAQPFPAAAVDPALNLPRA